MTTPSAPPNATDPNAAPARGPADSGRPRMPELDELVRLRLWQREALALFEASPEPSFLAVATPGAGKTTFALTAARRVLLARQARRVVVVVPTQHLKVQWAHAAERFDLHLDPEWASGYGALPSDVHGVVVTYQQVAANPAALRPLVRGALAVLDEVHHAGDSRAWGDGVRIAFEHAQRRLCLSGTPFRSDQSTIPFVRYDGELAHSDYEYGYGQALKDRAVVRPVYFPRINGRMEWAAPDGLTYSATFEDRLTKELASQRLRAALDVEGDWMAAVIEQAHAQLMHLRARDPRAGGLVIATDQDHARGIARIMEEKLRVSPTVATSDDPAASKKIAGFSDSQAPWIIAVRMVSEGVDIPRLRVGVYATNTLTELFFRQAVGRLVRWSGPLKQQTAYMFIPDDARLRAYAWGIAEQRRHSLRKREEENDRMGPERPADERKAEQEPTLEDQLSLFSVISSEAFDPEGRPLDAARVYEEAGADMGEEIPDLVDTSASATGTHAAAAPFSLTSPQKARRPVPLPEPEAPAQAPATSALARRRQLREQNAEIARELVHLTGRTHAEVNGELNRKVGVRRIGEATVRQLEQRLEAAKAWVRKL